MMTWKNCKFTRINFGKGKMHGWVARDRNGNVRGSISEASQAEMAAFRELKSAVTGVSADVDFESLLPDSWISWPELRSAVA